MRLNEFAEAFLIFADQSIPSGVGDAWTNPEADGQPQNFLWALWHLAIVSSARHLYRAVIVLCREGLHVEAVLPLRSLIEVATTQELLFMDKELGLKLLAEHRTGIRRFLERSLGEGADPDAINALLEKETLGRGSFARFIDHFPDARKDLSPLGLKPSQRLQKTRLNAYRRIYWHASDVVHMNARVLATGVEFKEGELRQRRLAEGPPATLMNATSIMLRIITIADASLAFGLEDEIAELRTRYHALIGPLEDDLRASFPKAPFNDP